MAILVPVTKTQNHLLQERFARKGRFAVPAKRRQLLLLPQLSNVALSLFVALFLNRDRLVYFCLPYYSFDL